MAHFAKIENGVVVQVIVVHDNDAPNEAAGLAFLEKLYGPDIVWMQTSYNTYKNVHTKGGVPLRKNYAGIGYTYDEASDAFIPPKPFASWTLNETTANYEPPVAHPKDGKKYDWDETALAWKGQETKS